MGTVFRPKDLAGDYRKIIEKAIKDFAPNTKDNVLSVEFLERKRIRRKTKGHLRSR